MPVTSPQVHRADDTAGPAVAPAGGRVGELQTGLARRLADDGFAFHPSGPLDEWARLASKATGYVALGFGAVGAAWVLAAVF